MMELSSTMDGLVDLVQNYISVKTPQTDSAAIFKHLQSKKQVLSTHNDNLTTRLKEQGFDLFLISDEYGPDQIAYTIKEARAQHLLDIVLYSPDKRLLTATQDIQKDPAHENELMGMLFDPDRAAREIIREKFYNMLAFLYTDNSLPETYASIFPRQRKNIMSAPSHFIPYEFSPDKFPTLKDFITDNLSLNIAYRQHLGDAFLHHEDKINPNSVADRFTYANDPFLEITEDLNASISDMLGIASKKLHQEELDRREEIKKFGLDPKQFTLKPGMN